jgi:hypothetical protein
MSLFTQLLVCIIIIIIIIVKEQNLHQRSKKIEPHLKVLVDTLSHPHLFTLLERALLNLDAGGSLTDAPGD